MHSEELNKALKEAAVCISDEVKNGFTGDIWFLCRQLGVLLPFLPVDGKDEYQLFTHLLLYDLESFDAKKMALLWMQHIDGVKIFPKLEFQFERCHKKWERNRRVQTAVENMKSDLVALKNVNEEQMPAEMDTTDDDMGLFDMTEGIGASDSMEPERGLLQYPGAFMRPAPMPPMPPVLGIRPDCRTKQIYVGVERIGGHHIPGQLPH